MIKLRFLKNRLSAKLAYNYPSFGHMGYRNYHEGPVRRPYLVITETDVGIDIGCNEYTLKTEAYYRIIVHAIGQFSIKNKTTTISVVSVDAYGDIDSDCKPYGKIATYTGVSQLEIYAIVGLIRKFVLDCHCHKLYSDLYSEPCRFIITVNH